MPDKLYHLAVWLPADWREVVNATCARLGVNHSRYLTRLLFNDRDFQQTCHDQHFQPTVPDLFLSRRSRPINRFAFPLELPPPPALNAWGASADSGPEEAPADPPSPSTP